MKGMRFPAWILWISWILLAPGAAPAFPSGSGDDDAFPRTVRKVIEGWTIFVDHRLLEGKGREVGDPALKALANRLYQISQVVPADPLEKMRKLEIRLELDNPGLKSMQYHPDRGWLVRHGHDPTLVKQVHIPHAKALLSKGQIFKHPWVVLHELAHAYHDQFLSFGHKRVLGAYRQAVKDKTYEKVLLFTGRKVRHYGLTNHKEYFAEATEAYFGMNDFYPFVHAELKEHDPTLFRVLVEIWGKRP